MELVMGDFVLTSRLQSRGLAASGSNVQTLWCAAIPKDSQITPLHG